MPESRRFRRASKWTTILLAAVVLAAFSFSWIRSVGYRGPGWGFLIDEGVLTAHWGFKPVGTGAYGWAVRPIDVRLGFRLLWMDRMVWPDGRTVMYLPLWIPLALLTPAALAAAWCARRRPARGACVTCGYNLTGNKSGICPECGTKLGEPGVAGARKSAAPPKDSGGTAKMIV